MIPYHRTVTVPAILALLALFAGGLRAQNHFGSVTADPAISAAITTSFSLDTLQKFVKQLSGVLPVTINGSPVTLPHRYAGNGSQQFRNAARFISDVFARYGLSPVMENNASPWTKINVVGTLPGRRAEYVVLCGHFDSANPSCPGADDNASGTAVVMEAARILRGMSFEYTIKFIAFGGEEQGMKGSALYVQQHAQDSIRAVINCDMTMWDNDEDKNVHIHAKANTTAQKSADLADFLIDVDGAYNLPVVCVAIIPGISASDHSSFWNIDRSAVLLIEEYQEDFNFYYHSSNDTFVNASAAKHQAFFQSVAKLAAAATAHLARRLAPTPVELASFTAEVFGGAVRLSWRTERETNNTGFHVERAPFPSAAFSPVGFVAGAGNSTQPHEYRFDDAPPASGVFAYRLRQVDSDGTESLSRSIAVSVGVPTTPSLAVWPNPASARASIAYSLPDGGPAVLRIVDALGRTAAIVRGGEGPEGVRSAMVDVSALPRGSYILILETPSGSAAQRLQVIH
ncbi:MAG: M20/M25/M40 family metallo-hydrolase [Bacteroidota bacterium]|nr:M20/M25/M40 family metallo-hydrolase [Bacteroidota bacterium]